MIAENIKKIYLGGSEVQKMYLGENLIYPREPADDYLMLGTTTGTTDFMVGNINSTYPHLECIKVHVVQNPGGINTMYVKQEDVPGFSDWGYNGFNNNEGVKILSIDKWNIDTSNVTNTYGMFMNCGELKQVDLRGFNTSKVTNMEKMFAYCYLLESLDISSFDTSNVTDMSQMFHNCTKLASLDLRSFDTTNVTKMDNMLGYCRSITKLYLSKNFFNSKNLKEYDFSKLKSWTDKESINMFYDAIIVHDGSKKTLKISSKTYDAIGSMRISKIKKKGWIILGIS